MTFSAPSIYQGIAFDGIRLEFKNGKIVDAKSNETKKLNKILDSDPGARYIGEFSLGFNPRILHPMRDILFDEKIAGSFPFHARDKLTKKRTTETEARSTGIW